MYAGFSLGAATAQTLALGDDKARGLLLLHGTSDIAESASVDELPVQLHVAEPDPFEPRRLAERLVPPDGQGRRRRGGLPIRRAPGTSTPTPDLPDYDEEAAEATWRVALGFLDSL